MSASLPSTISMHQSICNCTAILLKKCSSNAMNLLKAEEITKNLVFFERMRKNMETKGGMKGARMQVAADANADLYSAVILCLFAAVILMLMIRAIKPSETLDDQVNLLLNSMRVRCELDETERRRAKMREAKRKVQRWLIEAKEKSVRKLSFRKISKSSPGALQVRSPKCGTKQSQCHPHNSPSNCSSFSAVSSSHVADSRSNGRFSLMTKFLKNNSQNNIDQNQPRLGQRTVSAMQLNLAAAGMPLDLSLSKQSPTLPYCLHSNRPPPKKAASSYMLAPEIVVTESAAKDECCLGRETSQNKQCA